MRGRGRPGEGAAKPTISGEVSTDSDPKPGMSPPGVSTDSRPSRAPTASACAPYHELITEALGRGRNAMAIWQDLIDDHGFGAQYASVRRYVAKLRGATPAAARVVTRLRALRIRSSHSTAMRAGRGRTAPTVVQRQVPRPASVAAVVSQPRLRPRAASKSGGATTTRSVSRSRASRSRGSPLRRGS